MEIKTNVDKSKLEALLIYKKQFKSDDYKLIYHIVNTFYPVVSGDIENLITITSRHTNSSVKDIRLLMDDILDKYDYTQPNMVQFNCFSHMRELLAQEDMSFTHAHKKRMVTLKEYKFLIHRITKHLLDTEGCKSVMTNNYFLKSGFKGRYKKKTIKGLSPHKLAHMMQVLGKHKYLHITYNTQSRRVVQIGPSNPFYMLSKVPDITDEQEVLTKTDKTIAELTSQKTVLKHTLDDLRSELEGANKEMEDMVSQDEVDEIRTDLYEALTKLETMVPKDDYTKIQSELDEARRKTDALEQKVDYLQEQNDGLTEMILKKAEAEEQLQTYQYDEVEGSWVEYSGEGYGPIRLSLN